MDRERQREARRQARIVRALRELAERYHGDAGCITVFTGVCPACNALGLLED